MAWTRAIGMVRPSSIRPWSRACGAGIADAHGSLSPSRPSAVWTVKSAGFTLSRSSPATGNDTRHAGTDACAVGGDDCRAAGSGRVEEDLAVAVFADEGGRRQFGVEAFGPGGHGSGGGGHLLGVGLCVELAGHVHALGAARLHRAGHARTGERLADQTGRAYG